MNHQFFVITGLSGAGKSQALKILEDMGFFCIDNLPIALVQKFADLYKDYKTKWNQVAIGIDIRAGESSLLSLKQVLDKIKKKGIKYKIIYFNANDDTLLQRYSETRRRHPLGRRVMEGIKRERKFMERIRVISDQEIDTSNLTLGELKEIIGKEMNIRLSKKITVSLLSFGYKYGIPTDADLVIDVRFMPNPNYIPRLRHKTGRDIKVKDYVIRQKTSKEFFKRFYNLLQFLIPLYIKEGKSHLTLAIGCTGGRHRSVVVAESIAKYLKLNKFSVFVHHRDIEKIIR
ncbi:MAG: RNase adapter RapZ [Elusimicrobia bacterium]|nr:RNase adapter RapZ [Candidatus Liberimonas magnetica]